MQKPAQKNEAPQAEPTVTLTAAELDLLMAAVIAQTRAAHVHQKVQAALSVKQKP